MTTFTLGSPPRDKSRRSHWRARRIERCTAGSGRGPLEKDLHHRHLASGLPELKTSGPDNPTQLTYADLAGVQRISLTLRHLPGRVVIEVFDHDPNPPVLSDADTDAEGGRGLMLVQALSKEWVTSSRPLAGRSSTRLKVLLIHPDDPARCLIVRHSYSDSAWWGMPGGAYRPDRETPEQAGVREVSEELALTTVPRHRWYRGCRAARTTTPERSGPIWATRCQLAPLTAGPRQGRPWRLRCAPAHGRRAWREAPPRSRR